MRFILVILLLAPLNVWATSKLPSVFDDPSKTPFQALEQLYNQSQPANYLDFPAYNSPDLKNWSCTFATEDATRDQLKPTGTMNVFFVAKVVTVPAVPGTPAVPAVPPQGPLFPGKPAIPAKPGTPAQYRYQPLILSIPTDGSMKLDPIASGKAFVDSHYQLLTPPEFGGSFYLDPNDTDSLEMASIHAINGLIVARGTFEGNWQWDDYQQNPDGSVYYSYCWHN